METFYVVIGLLAAALLIAIGFIPGDIAKTRGHPNTAAVRVCGLVGIVLWPAWFVALIWAYTGPSPPKPPSPRP